MIIFLMIAGGLVLLFIGGESLVRGAVDIAKGLGVSPLLIGLLLVGFGTSTPELVTSLIAVFQNQPGIAVGNVIGSNIANILLIFGAAAVIYPVACNRKALLRDGSFMVAATLVMVVLVLHGEMTRLSGLIFLAFLAAYVGTAIMLERRAMAAGDSEIVRAPLNMMQFGKDLAIFIFGLVLTFLGAKLLVDGAIDLARNYGVSETIIGLTIVAVGTSLPELVASVMAAIKRHSDVAFGNIIGSNIYNILGILGVTAAVRPFEVPQQIIDFDIWVVLGATGLMVALSAAGGRVGRIKGAALLGLYAAYTLYLISVA